MHKLKIKNLTYKIVSFLIALILWITIKNIISPTKRISMTLPITFINADVVESMGKSYNVVGLGQCTIDFLVENNDKTLVSKSDFEAYVDLSDLKSTEYLNIHVNQLNNAKVVVNDIKVNPKTLHVKLDDVKRQEVEVKYVLSEELPPNRSIGYIGLSPDKVLVSGSNLKMKQLSHIEITIPVNNTKESFKGIADAKLISVDGKKLQLSDYDLAVSEISYSLTIYTNVNMAINQPPIEGKVDPDVNLDSIVVYPTELPVQCTTNVYKNFPIIQLPLINIDGIKETKVVEIPVKDILPVGVRCVTFDKITVTINVSEINHMIEPTAKAAENPKISDALRK